MGAVVGALDLPRLGVIPVDRATTDLRPLRRGPVLSGLKKANEVALHEIRHAAGIERPVDQNHPDSMMPCGLHDIGRYQDIACDSVSLCACGIAQGKRERRRPGELPQLPQAELLRWHHDDHSIWRIEQRHYQFGPEPPALSNDRMPRYQGAEIVQHPLETPRVRPRPFSRGTVIPNRSPDWTSSGARRVALSALCGGPHERVRRDNRSGRRSRDVEPRVSARLLTYPPTARRQSTRPGRSFQKDPTAPEPLRPALSNSRRSARAHYGD
jgi:hypothetical protein